MSLFHYLDCFKSYVFCWLVILSHQSFEAKCNANINPFRCLNAFVYVGHLNTINFELEGDCKCKIKMKLYVYD